VSSFNQDGTHNWNCLIDMGIPGASVHEVQRSQYYGSTLYQVLVHPAAGQPLILSKLTMTGTAYPSNHEMLYFGDNAQHVLSTVYMSDTRILVGRVNTGVIFADLATNKYA